MFNFGPMRLPSLPFAQIGNRTRCSHNPEELDISALSQCAQCGIPYWKRTRRALRETRYLKSCRILLKTGPIVDFCTRQEMAAA